MNKISMSLISSRKVNISTRKVNDIEILQWKSKISSLPIDIQKKIYIYAWKKFWKNYVPITARPPTWLSYHNLVKNKLWEAKQKNIHFLHLPFNTLPENKKWIMGCQCDFCKENKEIDPIEKHMHYLIQYRNNNYFSEIFMEGQKTSTSNWNEYLVPIDDNNNQYMKIFDPLCGSYKENKFTKNLREGYKFEFSYPI
jgi:hypothetical protein